MNKKGFTLIELIMVIVILGVLAAIALPKFYDLSSKAEIAAEAGVVGGIRAALAVYFAEGLSRGAKDDDLYPGDLENVGVSANDDSGTFELFNGILKDPVTIDPVDAARGWDEIGGNDYEYGPTGKTYTYYPTGVDQGRFKKTN